LKILGKDDLLKDDVEEHFFLDLILADIGVKTMKVDDAVDWEIATHTDIDEFVRNEDGKTDVDIKDDAMRTYLLKGDCECNAIVDTHSLSPSCEGV
jgi:hypothetical protein